MILKTVHFQSPETNNPANKERCRIEHIEGDNITQFDHELPTKGADRDSVAGLTGTSFLVDKDKKLVREIFFSDKTITEDKLYVYILNDSGKTIGKPIGK